MIYGKPFSFHVRWQGKGERSNYGIDMKLTSLYKMLSDPLCILLMTSSISWWISTCWESCLDGVVDTMKNMTIMIFFFFFVCLSKFKDDAVTFDASCCQFIWKNIISFLAFPEHLVLALQTKSIGVRWRRCRWISCNSALGSCRLHCNNYLWKSKYWTCPGSWCWTSN